MDWKIYKITNIKNGKIYIGQTKNKVQARFKAHLTAARLGITFRFYHAIRKYGEAAFIIEEIDTAASLEEASQKETHYINFYSSNHPDYGYNANTGGTGGWMIGKLSEERQKEWKEAVIKSSIGEKNARYCGTTNEEIKRLLIDFVNNFGYICGLLPLVGYGIEKNIEVPKHFTEFRFGGDYRNLALEVAKELNIQYDPYIRGKKRKISQYYKNLSKQRKMPHKIKELKTFEGKIEKIRNSKLGEKNYMFCGTTNEQLIELMTKFVENHGYYPTHKEFVEYGKLNNLIVPTAFTNSRFDGKYENLRNIIIEKTGIKYTKKRNRNGINN